MLGQLLSGILLSIANRSYGIHPLDYLVPTYHLPEILLQFRYQHIAN